MIYILLSIEHLCCLSLFKLFSLVYLNTSSCLLQCTSTLLCMMHLNTHTQHRATHTTLPCSMFDVNQHLSLLSAIYINITSTLCIMYLNNIYYSAYSTSVPPQAHMKFNIPHHFQLRMMDLNTIPYSAESNSTLPSTEYNTPQLYTIQSIEYLNTSKSSTIHLDTTLIITMNLNTTADVVWTSMLSYTI